LQLTYFILGGGKSEKGERKRVMASFPCWGGREKKKRDSEGGKREEKTQMGRERYNFPAPAKKEKNLGERASIKETPASSRRTVWKKKGGGFGGREGRRESAPCSLSKFYHL